MGRQTTPPRRAAGSLNEATVGSSTARTSCMPLPARSRRFAEHLRAVGTAEPEGIGQHGVDLHITRLVGYVVEVAVGVGGELIDSGRRDLIAYREHAVNGLDAAGGAEQVTGHRLGGAHRDSARVVAEGTLHREGLGAVADRRGGAVGVDVIDLVDIDTAVAC